MSFSTKRIIGICTKSRSEHITAQTRELECTKTVYQVSWMTWVMVTKCVK